MEWKKFDYLNNLSLKDDGNYLVAWQEWSGNYSRAHIAYWVSEDGKFFLIESDSAFPVCVDIWCEIPKLPHESI